MKISELVPTSNPWYNDYRFLPFFESHLTYLQSLLSKLQDVPENISARYTGDFYGLLGSMKIPIDLHYITLRLNGFSNSSDFLGEACTIFLPNESELQSLQNVYRTIQKQ